MSSKQGRSRATATLDAEHWRSLETMKEREKQQRNDDNNFIEHVYSVPISLFFRDLRQTRRPLRTRPRAPVVKVRRLVVVDELQEGTNQKSKHASPDLLGSHTVTGGGGSVAGVHVSAPPSTGPAHDSCCAVPVPASSCSTRHSDAPRCWCRWQRAHRAVCHPR